MTKEILWVLALVIIFIAMLRVWARRPLRVPPGWNPYAAKGALCSPTEREFLVALEAALPANQRAFAQVRLADVITTTTRDYRYLNPITRKHLDFVICDRATLQVLYAIELNDRSHDRADRRARDTFLANAMDSAGVPLHFFKATARYSPAEIQARLSRAPSKDKGSAGRLISTSL